MAVGFFRYFLIFFPRLWGKVFGGASDILFYPFHGLVYYRVLGEKLHCNYYILAAYALGIFFRKYSLSLAIATSTAAWVFNMSSSRLVKPPA